MIAPQHAPASNWTRKNIHSSAGAQALQIRNGCAHLGIEVVDGQSAATSALGASPLKLLIPRPRGPSVWAYMSSLGGGMVAGDEKGMELELGERACCFVSTQASTKVYRNPDSRPCSHWVEAKLATGSLLVHAPDPIQAFAGSSYINTRNYSTTRQRVGAGGLVLLRPPGARRTLGLQPFPKPQRGFFWVTNVSSLTRC